MPCKLQIVTLGNLIYKPRFLHLYKAQQVLAVIIAAITIMDEKTEAREGKRQAQHGGGEAGNPHARGQWR